MATSSRHRRLARASVRILQVVVYALLFSAVVFFGLTRTEVGRSELRQQVEAQFNSRFAGTLQIGALRGNLVNDLYASNVQVLDPEGRVLASVDSVVARPRWTSLLSGAVSVRSVTLYRPHLALHRNADGRWNTATTFRRTTAPPPRTEAIDVTVADVRVIDGSAGTVNHGGAPQPVREGWLFDYTDAALRDIDARATVEWSAAERLAEIYDVSFELPDAFLRVSSMQAQVVQSDDGWAVNQMSLATEGSRLEARGTLRNLAGDEVPDLDVTLDRSRIDHRELSRLVPRLPLAGASTLEGHVYGRLDRLVVETMRWSHGRSQAEVSGTVFGLPDSADVEARVTDTRLTTRDVRTVWPGADLSAVEAVQDVSMSGFVEGVVAWKNLDRPAFRAQSSLKIASPVGAVAGSLSVDRPRGRLTRYTASLTTDSLNPGALLQRSALTSRLNGRLWLQGRGLNRSDSLQATVDVNLRPSLVAGQAVDTLSLSGSVSGRQWEGTLDVTQRDGGRFRGRGAFDGAAAIPQYRLALTTVDYDLARGSLPVQARLPTTELNSILTLQGRGVQWDDLAGTVSVRVDTSTIVRSDSSTVLPPHWSTLHLAERSSTAPRVRAYGSIGSLTVEGQVPGPALVDLGRLWATALRDAVAREVDKPYPRTASTGRASPSCGACRPQPTEAATASEDAPFHLAWSPDRGVNGGPFAPAQFRPPSDSADASEPPASDAAQVDPRRDPIDLTPLRERARAALRADGYDGPLQLSGSLSVDQPEVVRAWWPAAPRFAHGADAAGSLTVGPDTLSVRGEMSVASLTRAGSSLDRLRVQVRTTGSLTAPLAETLDGRVDVRADTLRVPGQTITVPSLSAEYARREGALRLTAGTDSTGSPFRLVAGLDVRPVRNVLTLQDLYVHTGSVTWTNTDPGRIDLYADAAVIDSFAVRSPRTQASGMQTLRVYGTLSSATADTVFVEGDDVSLYPIFQLLGSPKSIGGLANGRVAVTGGLRTPSIAASAVVERLSFDRRLLGRLHASTRLRVGSPEVQVNASLSREPRPLDSLRATYAALVPGGLRTAETNELHLTGGIRVPTLGTNASASSPPRIPADSGASPSPAPDAFPNDPSPQDPGAEDPGAEDPGAEDPGAEDAGSDSALSLDLAFDVTRADLFFFEYIFEEDLQNVRGYTTGRGTITGTLTDPLFQADMDVREGRFDLPQFGLRYGIAGNVKVDEQGFHLRNVTVDDGDGTADIEGGVLFNDYRYFSFDLRGQLDEIQIIDVAESRDLPFYGSIRASGFATLTGPLSDARLVSDAARTTPESELFIPVSEEDVSADSGFIIFADSTGRLPNIRDLTRRDNILSDRPAGEPTFIDGLEIDVNVIAPEGSTVHLVFDPLVGDVVTAVGSGRVQLQQQEGEFLVYGQFNVSGGDYLFTAGEVFVRRFTIGDGTITWDGDPINAQLDLDAAYRTRASTRGLPGVQDTGGRIPVVINLDITGRVETPQVDLSLALARDERGQLVGTRTLDAIFNQPDAATEYATSVLLTNTFLLTTSSATQGTGAPSSPDNRLASAGNQLAFNSVSQLVASQLNRYLSAALPNVDVNFGLQGEDPEDLDVIYGVALRLLDERLVIRGEGVYTGDESEARASSSLGPQGEFVVEVRLSRRVSAEVFFRRQGDDIAREALTQTAGVGVSYQSEFSTWRQLYYRLFGWLGAGPDDESDAPADTSDDALATRPALRPPSPAVDSTATSGGDGE